MKNQNDNSPPVLLRKYNQLALFYLNSALEGLSPLCRLVVQVSVIFNNPNNSLGQPSGPSSWSFYQVKYLEVPKSILVLMKNKIRQPKTQTLKVYDDLDD